eukprot:TRINITY_DN4830_c0_g1_i1.p1 TRINITY_DN4830_c0_g1~~TRINITY_DN4830_c0_g1_i1.p1  ORF type:complete len:924 (+),score=113.08 TRINITY_DN4830_c0_g1_i1:105-2876(+)
MEDQRHSAHVHDDGQTIQRERGGVTTTVTQPANSSILILLVPCCAVLLWLIGKLSIYTVVLGVAIIFGTLSLNIEHGPLIATWFTLVAVEFELFAHALSLFRRSWHHVFMVFNMVNLLALVGLFISLRFPLLVKQQGWVVMMFRTVLCNSTPPVTSAILTWCVATFVSGQYLPLYYACLYAISFIVCAFWYGEEQPLHPLESFFHSSALLLVPQLLHLAVFTTASFSVGASAAFNALCLSSVLIKLCLDVGVLTWASTANRRVAVNVCGLIAISALCLQVLSVSAAVASLCTTVVLLLGSTIPSAVFHVLSLAAGVSVAVHSVTRLNFVWWMSLFPAAAAFVLLASQRQRKKQTVVVGVVLVCISAYLWLLSSLSHIALNVATNAVFLVVCLTAALSCLLCVQGLDSDLMSGAMCIHAVCLLVTDVALYLGLSHFTYPPVILVLTTAASTALALRRTDVSRFIVWLVIAVHIGKLAILAEPRSIVMIFRGVAVVGGLSFGLIVPCTEWYFVTFSAAVSALGLMAAQPLLVLMLKSLVLVLQPNSVTVATSLLLFGVSLACTARFAKTGVTLLYRGMATSFGCGALLLLVRPIAFEDHELVAIASRGGPVSSWGSNWIVLLFVMYLMFAYINERWRVPLLGLAGGVIGIYVPFESGMGPLLILSPTSAACAFLSAALVIQKSTSVMIAVWSILSLATHLGASLICALLPLQQLHVYQDGTLWALLHGSMSVYCGLLAIAVNVRCQSHAQAQDSTTLPDWIPIMGNIAVLIGYLTALMVSLATQGGSALSVVVLSPMLLLFVRDSFLLSSYDSGNRLVPLCCVTSTLLFVMAYWQACTAPSWLWACIQFVCVSSMVLAYVLLLSYLTTGRAQDEILWYIAAGCCVVSLLFCAQMAGRLLALMFLLATPLVLRASRSLRVASIRLI